MSIRLTAKLRQVNDYTYMHWCPGCNMLHQVWVNPPQGPSWTYNGNHEAPTFSPSIRVTLREDRETGKKDYCHYFIVDGKINFCGDCFHELSGKQGVEMPDFPEREADWY